jgi:glutamate---cysteine ligase / carboxylate-amine ligase
LRSLDPASDFVDPNAPHEQSWARWSPGLGRRYTVGVEEEVMLVRLTDHLPANSSEHVLRRLPAELARHTSPETHRSVIELATEVHFDVHGAAAELATLRARLVDQLAEIGLGAASAGTYPIPPAGDTRTTSTGRYNVVAESMRALARREPTMALHVHVGVPDPDDAVRLMNGLRGALPLLLALSANSPYSEGRDSGFASSRTVIFQGFPRTGTPRVYTSYADYVAAVDALITSGALPDPTYLWWDVRLQPALGTVEIRAMDAQTSVADSAGLIALVQALARMVLEGEPPAREIGPEVLAENRFLAARDGLRARLIDPVERRLVPIRELIQALVRRCRPYCDAIGAVELDRVNRLLLANGADRQRSWVREDGMVALPARLTRRFARSPEGMIT